MTPCFFGYGSLVNRATHDYPQARPAKLEGFRRIWVSAGRENVAFLSVHRAPGHQIDGLIAAVPGADWRALDQREVRYQRQDVTTLIAPQDTNAAVAVYQVPSQNIVDKGAHRILLSYLDVVVQGFVQVYGIAGAEAFFATTDDWSFPVEDDRGAPLYPRAQVLSAEERALTDRLLAQVQ